MLQPRLGTMMNKHNSPRWIPGWAHVVLLGGAVLASAAPRVPPVPVVRPAAMTAPMLGTGDVADDVCVWLHANRPERSLIIGVNKSDRQHGGLYVFQLDGARWGPPASWQRDVNWFGAGKKLNNVDICRRFAAGAAQWNIVAAANRTDRSIDVFRVRTDPGGDFTGLELAGRIPIGPGFAEGTDAPYGGAFYSSATSGRCFVFASDKGGRVAQYELRFNPDGAGTNQVNGRRHDDHGRPWQISEQGCEIEGIVADDAQSVVYFGSEDEGIFRYRLADGVLDPASKVVVDRVGPRLTADVEGLTLYGLPDGSGYLIASSQGSDRFVIYDRAFTHGFPNPPVAVFAIGSFGLMDGVSDSDGIDAVRADLGGSYPKGMFIAHDGAGHSPSNYKLVSWSAIAEVIREASPSRLGGAVK